MFRRRATVARGGRVGEQVREDRAERDLQEAARHEREESARQTRVGAHKTPERHARACNERMRSATYEYKVFEEGLLVRVQWTKSKVRIEFLLTKSSPLFCLKNLDSYCRFVQSIRHDYDNEYQHSVQS